MRRYLILARFYPALALKLRFLAKNCGLNLGFLLTADVVAYDPLGFRFQSSGHLATSLLPLHQDSHLLQLSALIWSVTFGISILERCCHGNQTSTDGCRGKIVGRAVRCGGGEGPGAGTGAGQVAAGSD